MKIYSCNISLWNDFDGLKHLCTDRKAQFERYKKPKDKLRCLVGGLLLSYALGHKNSPLQNAYGKPYFEQGPHFNISHSGDYVVLATSTHSIGIDVEIIKSFNIGVAKKCFTPNELAWLEKQNTKQAFFKIWTAKESIMKATGLGFSLNPSSFDVLPISDGPRIINEQKWFLYWHSFTEHELCMACAAPTTPNIIDLSSQTILSRLESIFC